MCRRSRRWKRAIQCSSFILEHAVGELGLEDIEVNSDDAIEFRQNFLEHEDGDYWAIPLSEVQLWIEQNGE